MSRETELKRLRDMRQFATLQLVIGFILCIGCVWLGAWAKYSDTPWISLASGTTAAIVGICSAMWFLAALGVGLENHDKIQKLESSDPTHPKGE